ncbi:MAG: hypothetical protein AseanaTS_02620 [Candidatus Pelagadaptatus aseana]|uniref:lysoplasmalogenase n=1 Tax=Candidatus Pelagadaptatus aseana TaxID=3120508 RepID=UPI0039B16FD4
MPNPTPSQHPPHRDNFWCGSQWLMVAVALSLCYLLSMLALPYPLHFLVKASPILWLALCCNKLLPTAVRTPMTLALLFSAAGDMLLALNFEHSFAAGLSSFLCAQLIYISVFFKRRGQLGDKRLMLLAIAIFYIAMLGLILPETGELKIPVTVYMTAICCMGALAALHRGSALVLLGAISFMVSDAVIAIDKFLAPFDGARLVIMNTYYLAQILIVTGLVETYRANADTDKTTETTE